MSFNKLTCNYLCSYAFIEVFGVFARYSDGRPTKQNSGDFVFWEICMFFLFIFFFTFILAYAYEMLAQIATKMKCDSFLQGLLREAAFHHPKMNCTEVFVL